MKKFLSIVLLLIIAICVYAQRGNARKGYRGYVDFALGDAYNLNTAQTISTNNMQLYSMVSTSHGFVINNWFVGVGLGYYHSFRDIENIYPFFVTGRYTFERVNIKPYIDVRVGIMYDTYWIEKIQKYGAMSVGINVYKRMQVGLRGSLFSRPSRYFTANAAIVLSYAIGK